MNDRAVLAALANTGWCRAVCAAHSVASRRTEALWVSGGPPPRFYPGIVTLDTGPDAEAALRAELAARPTAWGGVKDSFLAIDLSDLGWTELFRADWLWREPGSDGPTALEWRRATTASDLVAWEQAWEGGPRPDAVPRQFPDALLADPDVAFIAGWRDGAIVAVAALQRTGSVVGLSNVIGADPRSDDGWADLPAVAARIFPGLPLVGYERGADLEAARRHGFTSIGPLRVWVPPGA